MRFGPKAQPSKSVGFEPGIFGSGLEVLTHYTYSNFGQCIHKILLEIGYLEIGLSKILRKFNFILYGISYVKQKLTRTNYQPLLRLPNMFRSFFILWPITWPFLMSEFKEVLEFLQKWQLVIYETHFIMS